MVFYKPISIREAIENVNSEWYLPAIQRPYDWGERYKKKEFIIKLFDSVIRKYPIGTLIIWDTEKKIPFREFLRDFDSKKLEKIKDRGEWGNKKLIYDGQQRLQSLYSCLKYSFEGEILCYDMLYNAHNNVNPEGFKFYKKNKKVENNFLRLNELYSCGDNKIKFKKKIFDRLDDLTEDENLIFETNFDNLWDLFIKEDTKLFSYYPLHKNLDEGEVLDIFERINTTGMRLTNSEIVFSKVKRVKYDFEERIWERSKKIEKQSAGFSLHPDDILQILYLLVIGSMRVDPERIDDTDIIDFIKTWKELEKPLSSFFCDFLFEEFKINHSRIVRSDNALVPMIVYFYLMEKNHNFRYKDFSSKTKKNLKNILLYLN